VKIGIVGIDVLTQGKANLVDARIKQLREMFSSAKEVYIQVEIVTDEGMRRHYLSGGQEAGSGRS
jgi:hypothetical protein